MFKNNITFPTWRRVGNGADFFDICISFLSYEKELNADDDV